MSKQEKRAYGIFIVAAIIVLAVILIARFGETARVGVLIEEVDGSPAGYAYKIKVTNASLSLSGGVGTISTGASAVEDAAFGSGWNGDTSNSPSQNAVYDELIQYLPSLSDTDGDCLSAEPGTPVTGRFYCADANNWDPAGIGGTANYLVIYDGASYIAIVDEDGQLLVNTVQAAMNIIADNDGRSIAASEMNSIIITSGAADYDIPANQCDTVTGKWITLKVTAAVVPSLTSDDTADLFVLSDGTALDAQDELDGPGTAGSQVTVVCMAANKWYVSGEIGTWVDGGAP